MTEALDAIASRNSEVYVRYLVAAEQAVLRGEFNNAKVLRALAYSHRAVAMNACRAQGEALSAANNLSSSVLSVDEIDTVRDALGQQPEQVIAYQAALASKAIASLAERADVPEWIIAPYLFTCINCGYVVEGQKPEVCPICSALSTEFESFGPFYAADAEHLGQLSPDAIQETLGGTTSQIGSLIANIDDATLSAKPSATEWSVKEIIGHILETHILFVRRVDSILTGSRYEQPVLPWKLHEGKDYAHKHRDELMDLLERTCQQSIARIQNLTPRDWAMASLMLGGTRSVLDIGTWIANHDRGHTEQIKRLLSQ